MAGSGLMKDSTEVAADVERGPMPQRQCDVLIAEMQCLT